MNVSSFATNVFGRGLRESVPDEYPIAARGGKLANIQGFLTGTLDTVSRFVNTVRNRGETEVIPQLARFSEEQTRAQGVLPPKTATFIIIGIVVLVGAAFLFRR